MLQKPKKGKKIPFSLGYSKDTSKNFDGFLNTQNGQILLSNKLLPRI